MTSVQGKPSLVARLEKTGLPLFQGLASFFVYLRTCAPGLTWAHNGADGGDLLAAVRTLGIPHPPGYPLYVLAARLFSLLPAGGFAFRLNLFSAFCAALTVVCLYIWLRAELGRSALQTSRQVTWAAAVASLLFAFSPLFWSQAIITEVYALNALLAALCLVLSSRGRASASSHSATNLYMLLAFVYGLSLGNHLTMLLLLPPLVYSLRPKLELSGLRVLTALLAGLSVYLYLPLRAAAAPLINWGNPRSWGQFWWVISGTLYRQYVFALPRAEWWPRLLAWISDWARQFGPLGLLLAFAGLAILWRNSRRQFLFTLGGFLLYTIYAISYSTTDSFVYLIPAYLFATLWIARALLYFFEWAGQWRLPVALLIALSLMLPLSSLVGNFSALDLRHDHEASDYAEIVLELLPPQAIVITGSDRHTFALWYAQIAEERLDVLILDRDLMPYPWYRHNISPITMNSLSAGASGRPSGRFIASVRPEALFVLYLT
jgi:hypothetical protein